LRLLSWNVQWCRGVDGVVDPARIAAEARRLNADVICLQELAANFPELPGSTGEDQAKELEKQLSEYEIVFAYGVDIPGGGRRSRFGNLILSRLPVGRVLRHSLPWPPALDVPSMPRVAVEAVVESGFGPVRITTTHLEYYWSGHRAAQIERLRELHLASARKQPVKGEGPFRWLPHPASAILCGDFNLRPDDPLHGRMLEPFLDAPAFVDAWQALHRGAPHPHTFRVHEREAGESPYCCDFVFVTQDLVPRLRSMRVDGANRASDHQPVIVELE
jgi:endonuclease/exonuclease/phosphatase family metal-dependent hydrolase